jgi:Holliday junction resolvase RusA-like endonuclease
MSWDPVSDSITFTIPGEPVGKGRARAMVQAGHARMYTPGKTRKYEARVKDIALRAMRGTVPTRAACILNVTAYVQIPKSWTKRDTQKALDNEIRPTSKPDLSNVVKAIEDALNGAVYVDDSQIIQIHASRWYSAEPYVVVRVYREKGMRP